MSAHPDDPKQGPANHGAARAPGDLDAPTPPGGPQRADQPGGSLPPVEDPMPDPQPEIHPSSTPDGPSTVPTPDAVPEPDPHENPGGADTGAQALQQENAETSLDQPST
ncbi:hypothetical protein [Nocardioides massiliensis]|uniref:Uncharacterized protein n=1 Tax=Nocardioides massiliensis TaxID=1325935 RepID=A0ABT9NQL0_9ACTN|nr:hypothetical protein [Nocardioides massiliensis]MDP9822711.1 hypothetical protein [Nocardioides massiliensis]